jgi:biotin carboxyl carrier protein
VKRVTVEIDGKTVEGFVAQAKGVLWVHLAGETFAIDKNAEKRGRRAGRGGGASANPGEITAPMPGKIIKLLTKAGEEVKAQQVLLVMEAMKMEYTLKAQVDGKVALVACVAGEQVTLGQTLMKLETK